MRKKILYFFIVMHVMKFFSSDFKYSKSIKKTLFDNLVNNFNKPSGPEIVSSVFKYKKTKVAINLLLILYIQYLVVTLKLVEMMIHH